MGQGYDLSLGLRLENCLGRSHSGAGSIYVEAERSNPSRGTITPYRPGTPQHVPAALMPYVPNHQRTGLLRLAQPMAGNHKISGRRLLGRCGWEGSLKAKFTNRCSVYCASPLTYLVRLYWMGINSRSIKQIASLCQVSAAVVHACNFQGIGDLSVVPC